MGSDFSLKQLKGRHGGHIATDRVCGDCSGIRSWYGNQTFFIYSTILQDSWTFFK